MNTPKNGTDSTDSMYSIMMDSLAVAYVREVMTENGKKHAVCTADGTQLATFDTQDAAYFAAMQHDLKPVLVH